MANISVRRATADDVDAISLVLAFAFADYEWTRWTVDADNHIHRVESLQRLACAELSLPYGEVWVATTDDDGIVSAALWMRPDALVPAELWAEMEPVVTRLEGNRRVASLAADGAIAPHRPTNPRWYLGAVGTLPAMQRQGYGRAAVEPVLSRNEPSCLETCGADNVKFYESLGFVVTAIVNVPDGGPVVFCMSR